MDEFITRWVKPFYMKVLHGNYTALQGEELDDFVSSANQALSHIDKSVVERLLLSEGWRERLTGSWFAGLKGWDQFEDIIGSGSIPMSKRSQPSASAHTVAPFRDCPPTSRPPMKEPCAVS